MANARQRQLMQEALDDNLAPEALNELYDGLNQDAATADQFDRLKQVDRMMRNAPHERAPQYLALRIMQRLAESIKPEQLTRLSGLALALSLSLVTLLVMPLLVGIGWLLLTVIGSAAALNSLIQHVVQLLAIGISIMELFVRQVQTFISANPEVPVVMLSLIPISLVWLLRFAPRDRATNAG
ncbi:MAG: hypothetical protein K8L99_29090 [Anaerolineae bacterium]|nr:hypothetical protein [Anaerolineae bacterium]